MGSQLFTISELYSYSSLVRRNFAKKLTELPDDVVVKNREASFYTMKNILVHMIDNEDWIVNWVIHGESQEYVRKKSEEYTDITQVLHHLDEVEDETRAFLNTSNENEFHRQVDRLCTIFRKDLQPLGRRVPLPVVYGATLRFG